jgi:hypothetical protein
VLGAVKGEEWTNFKRHTPTNDGPAFRLNKNNSTQVDNVSTNNVLYYLAASVERIADKYYVL